MPELVLVPTPVTVQRRGGHFDLSARTTISAPVEMRSAIELLRTSVRAATGFTLSEAADADIRLVSDPSLAAEGYRLTVAPDGIDLAASTAAGALCGVQTLRQLLPLDCFGSGPIVGDCVLIPAVHIVDEPRFGWRGLHLDVARHFFEVDVILRLLDIAALHKFNVLHLHLTDDQGWRLPVPGYPRLTEIGSWRSGTQRGRDSAVCADDGIRHGGFYQRAELESVVAHAKSLGITIVPEVDMPGHMRAAIAAYPELGNTGIPVDVDRNWGISEHVLNFEDGTLEFCRAVLDEVADIFPGPFVHIGGDEVPTVQWQDNERAAARARQWGVSGITGLQQRFFELMVQHVHGLGRRVVGWDEVVDASAPPETVVMAWRDRQAGKKAVAAGYQVVLAPAPVLYFDYRQLDSADEPIGMNEVVTLDDVLAYEPVDSADPVAQQHVLGVQGQLWTEYIRTEHHLQYMLFPRACALAEMAWSAPESRDNAHFVEQLPIHLRRLDRLGIGYRRP